MSLRMKIPAAKASPAPPVGPILGQYGINMQKFCQQFNALTQQYKPGLQMLVLVEIAQDKTFSFKHIKPDLSLFIKQMPYMNKQDSITYLYTLIKRSHPNLQEEQFKKTFKNLLGSINSY